VIVPAIILLAANPQPIPAMFGGPMASLQKLASAARQCGYKDAAVTTASFGATMVTVQMPDAAVTDPWWDCLINWFLAHPKLELGFIGNRAYQP
jgi:hypothetical protein